LRVGTWPSCRTPGLNCQPESPAPGRRKAASGLDAASGRTGGADGEQADTLSGGERPAWP
jgi:hypothetical protein